MVSTILLPSSGSFGCYIANIQVDCRVEIFHSTTYIMAISGKDDTQIVLIAKYIVGFLVTRLPL